MKKLLVILAFFLIPSTAFAAIARDIYAISTAGAATSNTKSLTIGAGATLLVVWHVRSGGTDNLPTWNGSNMTAITGLQDIAVTSGAYKGSAFYMLNPTSGTHDLVVSTGDSQYQQSYSISYTGTGATQPDAVDSKMQATTGSLSSSITVVASNAWVATLGLNNGGPAPSTATGVLTKLTSDGSMTSILMDSNGTVSTGAQTYGFSGGNAGGDSALMAVSIAPAADITPIPLVANLFWFF